MKIFPMKIKSSPIEATTPNFAGFLKIKKNASFAAKQKFLPEMEILEFSLKQILMRKNEFYLNICIFIQKFNTFFQTKHETFAITQNAFHYFCVLFGFF